MKNEVEKDSIEARKIVSIKLLNLVKEILHNKPEGSYVRITNEGDFLLRRFGEMDQVFYKYIQEELMDLSLEHFKIVVFQVLSIQSSVTYNPEKVCTCSILIDNSLLYLKTIPKSNELDIKIVI